MENFFERVAKAWPVGRRDLHWHILPASSEAVELLASYPETVFSRPGLVRVPSEWLHCTLLHAVGISAADVDVDALVRDVRAYAQWLYSRVVPSVVHGFGRHPDPRLGDVHEFWQRWGTCQGGIGVLLVKGPGHAAETAALAGGGLS